MPILLSTNRHMFHNGQAGRLSGATTPNTQALYQVHCTIKKLHGFLPALFVGFREYENVLQSHPDFSLKETVPKYIRLKSENARQLRINSGPTPPLPYIGVVINNLRSTRIRMSSCFRDNKNAALEVWNSFTKYLRLPKEIKKFKFFHRLREPLQLQMRFSSG